jgi:hypothetical protein
MALIVTPVHSEVDGVRGSKILGLRLYTVYKMVPKICIYIFMNDNIKIFTRKYLLLLSQCFLK